MGSDSTLRDNSKASEGVLRTYSASAVEGLASAFETWQADSAGPVENLQSAVKEILSEAAFFGYPSAARLARKILATLAVLPSPRSANPAIAKTTESSLNRLLDLVRAPYEVALLGAVEDLCNSLEQLRDEADSVGSSSSVFEFAKLEAIRKPEGPSASSEHKDLNIYDNSAIDGMEKCTEEESWIVTQLATAAEDLAGRSSGASPANKLMSILRGHRFFQNVDRACIVGQMPSANQLVVVDSCIHERMKELGIKNWMPPGYSCFVDPAGSLSQMKPGWLRVFSDSHAVLESYAKQGKPAQRSIAYISESGLRSGICLAIGRGETVQGYLFMNSMQPNLFDHVMRDYAPLLSLFSLMGTITLDAAGFTATAGTHMSQANDNLSKHSEVFNAAEFKVLLQSRVSQQTAGDCHVELTIEPGLQFLFIPSVIAPAIAEVVCRLGIVTIGAEGKFSVNTVRHGDQLAFQIDLPTSNFSGSGSGWRDSILRDVERQYLNRPLTFTLEGEKVVVRIPYEPVMPLDQRVLYSVTY